ncbi:Eco57I restriction-modification methylase domain-containing protein [Marichromatium gracile]|uniref:site-specific DNA-methyltransferase (adenine-specific) n=1 Tax=Marichromatium gracile TaxID=1048 RepID=A0ABR5VL22_MARGR|nr:DNA methyltransferase [Marichromatium gracile]KXX66262.1 restriction endonuclease subunit M [Marichromatium gracile]
MPSTPLPRPLRSQLENTVKTAREVAEKAARAALERLAVGEAKAPDYLSEPDRALRRRLRAHGRALGDVKARNDTQGVQHLVWEVAYEHWHRMLFARFLAENGLLMWEPGAPVSLDDCRDMVDNHPDLAMGAKSQWELAGKLAAHMLPQVFKPQSPVFELVFAPEHHRELERLLAHLPVEVFRASDSLGWVYQFWQAKRKDEVNASEVKIGADELPAVTQLFTEPYMVDFLLHNALGAWWVTRHPDQPCPVPLTYLRRLDDGTPAAGRFEGWPDRLADFRLLDPCCGSGHFLVAAFLMLVPMRMAAEGLSAAEAVDAVLADNLHGLELDARCVEIAVFALALAAWRFPDEHGDPLGVRSGMPAPKIACCGLKVAASVKEWEALVPDDAPEAAHLREGLRRLHETFRQAPLLGSLLDPGREHEGDLFAPDYAALRGLLRKALSTEPSSGGRGEADSIWDCALSAQGLLEAAQLLDALYHLVITNVPYLARGKQSEWLKAYCERHYPEAKNDLANVFLERCLELSRDQGRGVVQIVMPQNWLFLTSYKKQRESLLKRVSWNLLGRLGPGAFETISGEVVQAILLTQTHAPAAEGFELRGVDASAPKSAAEKAALLREGELLAVSQKGQLGNPDARIAFGEQENLPLLSQYADGLVGLQTSDDPMFVTAFWEHWNIDRDVWEMMQGTPTELRLDAGASWLVRWERGEGLLLSLATAYPTKGLKAVGKHGVAIHRMQVLFPYFYAKERFHQNVAVIVPKDQKHLPAIWSFCSSTEYTEAVRRIDQKLNVTNATLVKVPFDLAHWQRVADERYPNGLPKPYSDDPTQWFFHGHPRPATDPLQVAVARLLGYRWPAETDPEMELSDEARAWIARCDALSDQVDSDGILCLPSVRGEKPAHERLLNLLIAVWDSVTPGSWRPGILDKLLADAGHAGKGLDVWLRDKFFEQHARRFHHRPFIWHVWDGLKDGFGALVNYHRLDAKHLERLIHTYLGDWIRQQETGVREGIDGAETRLAAAQDLKRRLELILEGEAPYDIFVRWKSLAEQPIGWTPDLNDGVRLNIRPFMTAEVLRHNKKPKLNIHWNKDRGKDVESAPWFPVFKGERINDHHLTLAEKAAARGKA